MTTFTLQNKSSAPSYSLQNKNNSSFSLQNRDLARSLLLTEALDIMLTESEFQIALEQSAPGDIWSLQNKN